MIKKLLICILLSLSIVGASEVPKDRLLGAVIFVESRYTAGIIKKDESAVGILQIRPIMIEDVNRICRLLHVPRRYYLKDRLSVEKSIEIWYIVQQWYNPQYDLTLACIVWNGRCYSGDGDQHYLALVKNNFYIGSYERYNTVLRKRPVDSLFIDPIRDNIWANKALYLVSR